MRNTRYALTTDHPVSFKACIVADLHDASYKAILPILRDERPDLILIPGDLTETLSEDTDPASRPGLSLLSECAAISPTFYAFGNHEIGGCHGNIRKAKRSATPLGFSLSPVWREIIDSTGATLIHEGHIEWNGLTIGALGSGLLNPDWVPDLSMLDSFVAASGYKLLLCHHPEYFDRYLRPYPIDLTVSGHAHGGQWRVFGRGIYAPDQGFFPRYTGGVHESRLVISKGTSNTVPFVSRLFNPREVVTVEVRPK